MHITKNLYTGLSTEFLYVFKNYKYFFLAYYYVNKTMQLIINYLLLYKIYLVDKRNQLITVSCL